MKTQYQPKKTPYRQQSSRPGVMIGARVPKSLHRQAVALARRKRVSLSCIMEAALRRTLSEGDVDVQLVPFRPKTSNGKREAKADG